MSDYYPPRTRVRVIVAGDPFTGRLGVVDETRNDAGDMVHRVAFRDGGRADYYADEIAGNTAPHAKYHTDEQD